MYSFDADDEISNHLEDLEAAGLLSYILTVSVIVVLFSPFLQHSSSFSFQPFLRSFSCCSFFFSCITDFKSYIWMYACILGMGLCDNDKTYISITLPKLISYYVSR